MPCFDCKCFREGVDGFGNRIGGGRGYCEIWDEVYYRSHECRKYAPIHYYKSNNNKSSGGCFLTGACVDYLGLPDDCKELTVLRNFRDNVLKATDEGMDLVNEYYTIAPTLVDKINASDNKAEIYADIYKRIQLCITAIENDDRSLAVQLYKDMVCYVENQVVR